MAARHAALTLALLTLLAGCVTPSPPPPGPGGPAPPPQAEPSFEAPVVIDAARGGFEPTLLAGPDGLLVVCSPRGLGRGTDLWRSLDGGATWGYVGLLGQDAGGVRSPVLRAPGADLGGGDCDLASDAAGTLYLADLWVGGTSVAASRDRGATWEGVPVSQAATPQDRPWLLGGAAGEVFLAAGQTGSDPVGQVGGVWVLRSTDGGKTFPQQVKVVSNEARFGVHGNLARAGSTLAFPYARELGPERLELTVAVSHDQGRTWTSSPVAQQDMAPGGCSGLVVFPVLAGDGAGTFAFVWAMQRGDPARIDLFLAVSADSGATWSAPVPIADRPGARAFPWAAMLGGRLGVAWYETEAPARLAPSGDRLTCVWEGAEGADWRVRFASFPDARASASFSEGLVQAEPVHRGALDRPYAEKLHVAALPDGRAGVVYVADVPEGAARPLLALERAG